MSHDLISPAYVAMQEELHASPRGYGGKGHKWAEGVLELIRRYQCGSVLDYGCGQGSLVAKLRLMLGAAVRVDEYDPAIPGKNGYVEFADLVVCTDVLEHVEPDKLDNVLAHIRKLTKKAALLVVATRPSSKHLSDGRNAHLILELSDWWERKVTAAGFTIQPDPPISPLAKPSREWVAVVTP